MPVPSPLGCISKNEEVLKDMLANCSTFITWTGELNATAAETHIYPNALPPATLQRDAYSVAELRELRPFAIVYTSDLNGFRWHELYGPSGDMVLRLEQDVPDAYVNDLAAAERDWKNTIGKIVHSGDSGNPGLLELSRASGYLHLTEVRLLELQRTTEDDRPTFGDAEAAILMISYGTTR